MRRAVLCLVAVLMPTCAHQPPPVQHVTVIEDDVPRYFSLPATFHDHDLVCLDADLKGTCATVGEVKLFLTSRRAQP